MRRVSGSRILRRPRRAPSRSIIPSGGSVATVFVAPRRVADTCPAGQPLRTSSCRLAALEDAQIDVRGDPGAYPLDPPRVFGERRELESAELGNWQAGVGALGAIHFRIG